MAKKVAANNTETLQAKAESPWGENVTEFRHDEDSPSSFPPDLAGFRAALMNWYDRHKRDLPWRGERDLYRVWLSEIMLQQTQVNQVIPYYERFVGIFPSLNALAAAELKTVLLAWEGLGYYARARNLHKASRQVAASGKLPQTCADLRKLPGIGPYTARAIASIVYDEPQAVVDGNVRRVISRLRALDDSSAASLQSLADKLLDRSQPGEYNQAVMELGSQVCTPRSPACARCPVRSHCRAYACGTPEAWPVRRKKQRTPHYDIAVGILVDSNGRIFIQQRAENALLGGLWELPGGKQESGETITDTCRRELYEELGIAVAVGSLVGKVNHAYTHFRITLWAFRCRILEGSPVSAQGLPTAWVFPDQLKEYPFPRANRRILDLMSNSGIADS